MAGSRAGIDTIIRTKPVSVPPGVRQQAELLAKQLADNESSSSLVEEETDGYVELEQSSISDVVGGAFDVSHSSVPMTDAVADRSGDPANGVVVVQDQTPRADPPMSASTPPPLATKPEALVHPSPPRDPLLTDELVSMQRNKAAALQSLSRLEASEGARWTDQEEQDTRLKAKEAELQDLRRQIQQATEETARLRETARSDQLTLVDVRAELAKARAGEAYWMTLAKDAMASR